MLTHLDNLSPVNIADPVNRQHTLNRGRVAWLLALPELAGGGKWYDIMGQSHGVLTLANNANSGWRPSTRPGGFGSVATDGSASYVDLGAVLSGTITQGTIAGWMYRSSASNLVAFGFHDSPNTRWNMTLDNAGNLYGTLGNGNPGSYLVVSCSLTGWHRFLFSFNNATSNMYIDGARVSASGATASAFPVSTYTFKVGIEPAFARYSTGQFDDISVWNRTLSAQEAFEDYNLSRMGYPGVLNRWPQRMVDAASGSLLYFILDSGAILDTLLILPPGLSLLDTTVASDLPVATAAATLPDTAAATDTLQTTIAAALLDPATATDLPVGSAAAILLDSSGAADTVTALIAIALADGVAAVDQNILTLGPLSLQDVAGAVDLLTASGMTILYSQADTVSGVDAQQALVTGLLLDAGAITETLQSLITVGMIDAAVTIDTLIGTATITLTDPLGTTSTLTLVGLALTGAPPRLRFYTR